MAKSELIYSISSLSKKIDSLLELNKSLLTKIEELENENNILRIQNLKDKGDLEKAHKEIDFLIISHRLAASPEALIETRNKISSLIRNIDSCIRLIKED